MTASVPFSAPPTPPLTGLSICTMLCGFSASEMRIAIREPVVERSTKRRTFLPLETPSGPVATVKTTSGVGRLANTVSTRSAMSRGEEAAVAPSAVTRETIWPLVSNTTSRWPASIKRRAIG
jgi:hypothetical protein